MTKTALTFDEKHFKPEGTESGALVWATPDGDGLRLYHYPVPPDIGADPHNIRNLRAFYRRLADPAGLGIIEIDTVTVADCLAIRTIFKAAPASGGRVYLGGLTFPFRDFSYVLKSQCEERGPTGMRDTVVYMQMMESGETGIDEATETMTGWLDDPYNPFEKGPMTRNKSERREYDAQFPQHPLSRLRRVIDHLERTVVIDESTQRQPAFSRVR